MGYFSSNSLWIPLTEVIKSFCLFLSFFLSFSFAFFFFFFFFLSLFFLSSSFSLIFLTLKERERKSERERERERGKPRNKRKRITERQRYFSVSREKKPFTLFHRSFQYPSSPFYPILLIQLHLSHFFLFGATSFLCATKDQWETIIDRSAMSPRVSSDSFLIVRILSFFLALFSFFSPSLSHFPCKGVVRGFLFKRYQFDESMSVVKYLWKNLWNERKKKRVMFQREDCYKKDKEKRVEIFLIIKKWFFYKKNKKKQKLL